MEKVEAKMRAKEYDDALEHLQEGKSLVAKRMKVIQLADKSKLVRRQGV